MTAVLPPAIRRRIARRLRRLYGGERAPDCLARLEAVVERHPVERHPVERHPVERHPVAPRPGGWSERDLVLITYGDTLRRQGEPPLRTLKRFADERLAGAVSAIHVLPFFPYSSDDGFSVIDYRRVRPDLGDWSDVGALGEGFRLGFDLVLNHASARSEWVRQFRDGEAPGRDFFACARPDDDLSAVVRPRTHPLLTPVETASGTRHVWTTFSADQVDLDFSNPDVLLEFVDIVLEYVARGAGLLRLDAIAFLWKQVGTPCLHLAGTHEVVKLLRDVLDVAAPGTWLLTETNVPHAENVSYFGAGDEAHMVYQFSLPPLLLHALTTGDATHLTRWAAALEPPPPGCTFLNFTASHDGVGVRPLEGLLPDDERRAWIDGLRRRGVHVATKRDPDGGESPYELNVTYVDALEGDGREDESLHLARFLASQTAALTLRGIPAVYLHSLVGTRDWHEGVAGTGRPRTINRRSWDAGELSARLSRQEGFGSRVFGELTRRIRIRTGLRAFHPDADQRILDLGPALFAVLRGTEQQRILALTNVGGVPLSVPDLAAVLGSAAPLSDLLAPAAPSMRPDAVELPPYGCAWLTR